MKKHLLLIAVIAVFFSACTIEKRHYTDGYHVEWHHRGKGEKVKAQPEQINAVEESVAQNQTVVTESNVAVVEQTPATVTPQAIAAQTVAAEVAKMDEAKAARRVKAFSRTVGAMGRKGLIRTHASEAWNAGVNVNTLETSNGAEPDTVLLIILALFIPPLAVYLYEGMWDEVCTLNLILSILCWVPGIIHALIVILGD